MDYYVQNGIGKSKYSVSFHDGKTLHNDGSRFYDLRIFKNKRDLNVFISKLEKNGYLKTQWQH